MSFSRAIREQNPIPMSPLRPALAALGFAVSVISAIPLSASGADSHWVGLWANAPLAEDTPPPIMAGHGALLREVVRISHAAKTIRLHLSNEYGKEPLRLQSVHVAIAGPRGSIADGSDHEVRFSGRGS